MNDTKTTRTPEQKVNAIIRLVHSWAEDGPETHAGGHMDAIWRVAHCNENTPDGLYGPFRVNWESRACALLDSELVGLPSVIDDPGDFAAQFDSAIPGVADWLRAPDEEGE